MLTGTLLVLLTWGACLAAVIGVGLLPSLVTSGGQWTASTLRVSLWWGFLVLTVVIVGLSVVLPLRSAGAAAALLTVIAAMSVAGVAWAVRARRPVTGQSPPRTGWWWLLASSLGFATLYLAAAAIGPVTNYDSGLYHLGAIKYAGDFSAVPGLANLYFPFGYANAEFPLAAVLGNGPWDGIGYRLLNGLLLTLVAVDLLHRGRARRLTAGFFILAVGVAAAWVPMVALSDYWVTSPTSDSAVFALTLVAVSYVADAVATPRRWRGNASVAFVVAVLTVMLRPTMAVFAVAVVAVLAVVWWRGRARIGSPWPTVAMLAATGGAAALAATARDYLLSGWVQFPLSVHAFEVDWLAPDPVEPRTATLGAARDPADLWNAAAGWDWIGPWIRRLPTQWETFEFLALMAVAVAIMVVAHRRSSVGLRWRALGLAMTPSTAAVVFWWGFTPPSFRFIWGPLFTLAAIPLGWALWRLHVERPRPSVQSVWPWVAVVGIALPVVAVTLFSVMFRFHPSAVTQAREWTLGVSVPYSITPITVAPVADKRLTSGLLVRQPTQSDQCWDVYPLCTPQLLTDITQRGSSIQDGFAQKSVG